MGPITGTIGTIPERLEQFKIALDSIIDQVDILHILFNKYREIPFDLPDKCIPVIDSTNQYNSLGRLKAIEKEKGIIFSFDDDIIYPSDYKERMLKHLNNCMVCVHGSRLSKDFNSYRIHRKITHFRSRLRESSQVDIPGVGTSVWDNSQLKFSFDMVDNFEVGADVWVAYFCARVNLPIISIKRIKSWLKPIETTNKSLFFTINNKKRTKFVKEKLC